jgi:hypothetical protein
VVVRQWTGNDEGPGGHTGFRTHASVQPPRPPCAAAADRRLREHCGLQAAKPPGEVGHPPQNTERAVRVQVLFPRLLCARATAERLPCEPEARGGKPVGWPRWRRQLLEQTRALVMVWAPGAYGLFPLAEYSLLVGVKRTDVPPGIGTRQDLLAKYRLSKRG